MKYMAPVLALLLSSSAHSQEATLADPLSVFSNLQAMRGLPVAYTVSCPSADTSDFIYSSFQKGKVHGWMMAAILSQDTRDGASQQRDSMGACELDTYESSLTRMVLDGMEQLDPKVTMRHYLMLPAMPPTFFEQSEHGEEEETSSYSSGNKG